MALPNRPSSLAGPDLIITEYRFLIHSSLARPDLIITEYQFLFDFMEKSIRKLQLKIDRDPTVGSQVMALANSPSSLARPDLIITEYRFLIHSMEKGNRKLQ